jgi:hypothetical protein
MRRRIQVRITDTLLHINSNVVAPVIAEQLLVAYSQNTFVREAPCEVA